MVFVVRLKLRVRKKKKKKKEEEGGEPGEVIGKEREDMDGGDFELIKKL